MEPPLGEKDIEYIPDCYNIILQPGQRCSGRNYQGRRCCTPEYPCNEGEGDCDGPGDGGGHDDHRGCKGDLVCGSNNCKQFGHYYHEKDDCCQKAEIGKTKDIHQNCKFQSIIIKLDLIGR